MKHINIAEKFSKFQEHWSPKIIGEMNGQHIKLAKFLGEFIWHKHDDEDELFLVIEGTLKIEFRDKTVIVQPGELIIVPRGIEHKPVAEQEVSVMLFEPAGTLNTGDATSDLTKKDLERI